MKKVTLLIVTLLMGMFIFNMEVKADYYTCEDHPGYTLSGTNCIKTENAYSRSGAHWCNGGVTPKQQGNRWICEYKVAAKLVETEEENPNPNEPQIPDGYVLKGPARYRSGYYCENGWIVVGASCYGPPDETASDPTDDDDDDESGEGVEDGDEFGGGCPFGDDVLKDIAGAWKIVKIIVPIIALVLSMFELIKTVAKGDPNADLKKVGIRFGKRVALVIILFSVISIVNLVFNTILEIDGCDLSRVDTVETSN